MIALCQINTTIGDYKGNLGKIKKFANRARDLGADLAVFPELCLCGYPPKDFLEDPNFLSSNFAALEELVRISKKIKPALLVGFIGKNERPVGKPIFNSAALIQGGKLLFVQNKSLLPTYDVFDEGRYFEKSDQVKIFDLGGKKLGISICEDIWNDENFWKTRMYHSDPIEKLSKEADILINISSSPYYIGKRSIKEKMLRNVCKKYSLPLVYVNLVGANDDLIFEGRSLFIDGGGNIKVRMKPFKEAIEVIDPLGDSPERIHPALDEEEEILEALTLGTRDYVRKCGFKQVVIGLSGGIDSALVAYIAKQALGAKNVQVCNMPSKYSSRSSVTDSRKLARNLGIKYEKIDIAPIVKCYEKTFKQLFGRKKPDITEENIQARIRANILMAVSNKLGKLVLSCGNKSELAVGYTTLYGDLSGGLAVISDLPKTRVFELARYINRKREIIPASILEKPPSAELKPDQTDQDELPPYDVLDEILYMYIEEGEKLAKISKKADRGKLPRNILNKVLSNEYKRKQAPPGLKVTTKAFGYGRRFPVAHKFKF